jgi:ubiquinone/menaquinone biosynthesis C-methylase UbiE
MSSAASAYVMGHTDRERRRLALQASVINPLTDNLFRRAGVSAGMHVLELGCGIGEVSLIAARLVGPHGHVHCLDIDPVGLEIARGRIRSAGHDHVTFEEVEVMQHTPARPYDAVIGRHILIHTADALAVLRKAVEMVHVGGLIAFQEHDVSYWPRGYPDMPLMHAMLELASDFWRRVVPRANIGAQLFWLMQEAGLPPPECRVESVMDGGPYSPVYEWIAETVRSLLPRMEGLGMTTAAAVDIDTLAQRLRQEALEKRGAVIFFPLVGAFARKPLLS